MPPPMLTTTRVIGRAGIGKVVGLLDGDTIEDLHNTHLERVRLSGIDCPEQGHAYGNNAKRATSALVFGERSHAPDLWQVQVRAQY